jgi:hypothetical protein
MQNTSHAVMAQRVEPKASFDDFPTPPWATRALLEHVIGQDCDLRSMTCLEPACGDGHMARPLAEYFGAVQASDVQAYGFGDVTDFTNAAHAPATFDWVISNPPFSRAEAFALRAMPIARRGVAMLTRTVFIESVGRYGRMFSPHPPSKVAQFVERVPMVKGRLDRNASTATSYAWLVWEKASEGPTRLIWIPPCRKRLERDSDYPGEQVDLNDCEQNGNVI